EIARSIPVVTPDSTRGKQTLDHCENSSNHPPQPFVPGRKTSLIPASCRSGAYENDACLGHGRTECRRRTLQVALSIFPLWRKKLSPNRLAPMPAGGEPEGA